MEDASNSLVGKRIGIELLSGDKIFGEVHGWSAAAICVIKDGSEKPIDVPRKIIVRSLIVFDGGK